MECYSGSPGPGDIAGAGGAGDGGAGDGGADDGGAGGVVVQVADPPTLSGMLVPTPNRLV